MPTKPDSGYSASSQILSSALAHELETVVEAVNSVSKHIATGDNAIALVRVFDNVTPGEWERLASTHCLRQWLCIPIKAQLADSVSTFLEMQRQLAFQRDHDPLTGIANRGYFNQQLEDEVKRALRSRTELSLLYVDIDDFKIVNDTYGHCCGDEVLKRLARVLHGNVRPYDIVARVGGEEFCVILPATSCWTAFMLGNRLLGLFRRELFTCDDKTFSLTFSGGVSSLSQLEDENKNSTGLLKRADKALYDAKGRGKNLIRLAESERYGAVRSSLVQAREKEFLFSFRESK